MTLEKNFEQFRLIIKTLVSLTKILISSNFFLKKRYTLKSDIYILGNGPSLNKTLDLYRDQLKISTLMCVNGFSQTKEFIVLKPKYFIINAPEFYTNTTDSNSKIREKTLSSLIGKTTWNLILFLPADSKKNKEFIQRIKKNNFIEIYYFNKTPVDGLNLINSFLYAKGLGSPRPHNVLISGILQAINVGFNNIYLLGADHSWLPLISVNQLNETLINQKHFYDLNTSKPKTMHKGGHGKRKLHEVLEKFYFSFRSYHQLQEFASKSKTSIINLTENSFIDAFKKIKSEDHFG